MSALSSKTWIVGACVGTVFWAFPALCCLSVAQWVCARIFYTTVRTFGLTF